MRRSGLLAIVITSAAVMSLSGCRNPFAGDEWRRTLGVIDVGGSQLSPLQMPDTVAVGTKFDVTVTTYGSSTCTRADGAHVEIDGLVAVIRPYDRVLVEGVCTDDLAPFPRDVELRFDATGDAIVRVVGRTVTGFPAEIEGRLFVRP